MTGMASSSRHEDRDGVSAFWLALAALRRHSKEPFNVEIITQSQARRKPPSESETAETSGLTKISSLLNNIDLCIDFIATA
jgi:hypothetical protein